MLSATALGDAHREIVALRNQLAPSIDEQEVVPTPPPAESKELRQLRDERRELLTRIGKLEQDVFVEQANANYQANRDASRATKVA